MLSQNRDSQQCDKLVSSCCSKLSSLSNNGLEGLLYLIKSLISLIKILSPYIHYQILLKLIISPRGPTCALNFLREALLLATPERYNPLLDPPQWINSPQAVLWVYLTSSSSPCQLATGFSYKSQLISL